MKPFVARGRGDAFFRSVASVRARIDERLIYGLKRHGGWFRPEARGYTRNLAEIGLFNAEDARAALSAEGVVAIHVSELKSLFDSADVEAMDGNEITQFLPNKKAIDENYLIWKKDKRLKAAPSSPLPGAPEGDQATPSLGM